MRIASPTWRTSVVVGSTRSSGVPNRTPSSGAAASSRINTTGTPVSNGLRVAVRATAAQNGVASPRMPRTPRMCQASDRSPSTASSAGSVSTAASAEIATTPMPA
ncbi:Uncharacterised protein [Mycobacteroides abscessus subsp. abscessus]|nr:Uncharacterised protein [Mycobacteroides abscessus subsp. abscessus]